MKCPQCGGAEMEQDVKDIPYSWRGKKTLLQQIRALHCPKCGETVMDKAESAEYMAKVVEFKNSIINDTVKPAYIMTMRKKLELSQREAGRIFGGGDNAFYRYEAGKSQPHPSTVKLLKLLDRHPELLNEIYG